MIRQSAPLQVAMVAYSCVGVSRVTIRLQVARIAEWQGPVVRVHLISSRRGGRTWVTMPDIERFSVTVSDRW
jgi:hypothetical protein